MWAYISKLAKKFSSEGVMETRRILLVAGCDGWGPWSFLRAVAGALVVALRDVGLGAQFIVEGWEGGNFHTVAKRIRDLGGTVLDERPRPEQFLYLPRDSDTQLVRPEAICELVLIPFETRFEKYLSEFETRDWAAVDLVLAVVDPIAVAAIKRLLKEGETGPRTVLVTDHFWDWTLQRILEEAGMLGDANRFLESVASLYGRVDRAYLWPPPITPLEVFAAASKVGRDVRRLTGVLESPLKGGGDLQSTRRDYGLDNGLPTVIVTTGATGSLRTIFDRLEVSYYSKLPEGYNLIINTQPRKVFTPTHWLEPMTNPPVVDLAPLVEFGVTRCGGGTVNGLIAARAAWYSVLEPFHAQVNAIAECAEEMELAPIVGFNNFAIEPRSLIESWLFDESGRTARELARSLMAQIPHDAESQLAEEVVEQFLLKKRGI